jgi:mono/diheme cytochrome c family protein
MARFAEQLNGTEFGARVKEMTSHYLLPAFALAVGVTLTVTKPAVADPTFEAAVAPFVQAHCAKCHGPNKQSGDFRIDELKGAPDDLERWLVVREQLREGLMPPSKETRPDSKATQQVIEWIESELRRAGKNLARPQPQYGNEVPHDPLFDPENAKLPASTPARYWRLSPYIYRQYMTRQHSSGNNLVSPFNLLPGNGFKDYALPLAIDEPTAALLWINAEALVNSRLRIDPKTGKIDRPQYREIGEAFEEELSLTDVKVTKIVTEEFKRILGRAPEADELTRWTALLKANIATGGRAVGLRMTLAVLYMHPEVVYRKEVGEGPADSHGRRMLSPRELTFAITYALGDKWPDTALLKAAETGNLATHANVVREVNRLFDDPKFEKPRILRFFHEYFGYRNAVNVFKTDALPGTHDASWSVADTDMLIAHLLQRDKNVLTELLATQDVFVTTDPFFNKNSKAHYVYNFTEPQPHLTTIKGERRSQATAPAGQRAGILTQPSWLLAHSTNFDNHAIARGHWIRERLLGGTIPSIPLNVDAKLPDDPDKTLRERMHVTRAEYCWKCHQKMDPLGMPFEIYSHFGRFRESETVLDPAAPPPAKGKKPATREIPVDASGEIAGTGDSTLDGPVTNAVEMMKKLSESPRVEQVFIRHAFRYWMGRNETLADASTLQAAHTAYKESGGSFRALVVSLITSDSFLYRSGDQPSPPTTLGK